MIYLYTIAISSPNEFFFFLVRTTQRTETFEACFRFLRVMRFDDVNGYLFIVLWEVKKEITSFYIYTFISGGNGRHSELAVTYVDVVLKNRAKLFGMRS